MGNEEIDYGQRYAAQAKLNKLFVHDLKNPISALSANLSFLEMALVEETEEVRDAISDSLLACEMLLRFSENLNLIAMLELGEFIGNNEVSLGDFINSVVRRNIKFAESAGIRLETETLPDGVSILLQYRYAELALENLILSAVRYSPQGSKVVISTETINDLVRISVRDYGKPVEKDMVGILFKRETQAEAKKHSNSRYGRGLGLYAAGLAVEAIDGRIEVGTKEDMTEFALLFPRVSNNQSL